MKSQRGSRCDHGEFLTPDSKPVVAKSDDAGIESRCQIEWLALEASRDSYIDLYEFAPVGYLTLTHDGLIAEVNLTGAALLMGNGRSDILRQPFAAFISSEDKARYHRLIDTVRNQSGRRTCAIEVQRADGSIAHVQLDC